MGQIPTQKVVYLKLASNFGPFNKFHFLPMKVVLMWVGGWVGLGWLGPQTPPPPPGSRSNGLAGTPPPLERSPSPASSLGACRGTYACSGVTCFDASARALMVFRPQDTSITAIYGPATVGYSVDAAMGGALNPDADLKSGPGPEPEFDELMLKHRSTVLPEDPSQVRGGEGGGGCGRQPWNRKCHVRDFFKCHASHLRDPQKR